MPPAKKRLVYEYYGPDKLEQWVRTAVKDTDNECWPQAQVLRRYHDRSHSRATTIAPMPLLPHSGGLETTCLVLDSVDASLPRLFLSHSGRSVQETVVPSLILGNSSHHSAPYWVPLHEEPGLQVL